MRGFAVTIDVEARVGMGVSDDSLRAEIALAIAGALARQKADSLSITTVKRRPSKALKALTAGDG